MMDDVDDEDSSSYSVAECLHVETSYQHVDWAACPDEVLPSDAASCLAAYQGPFYCPSFLVALEDGRCLAVAFLAAYALVAESFLIEMAADDAGYL